MTIDGILVMFELMRHALGREVGEPMEGRKVPFTAHDSFKNLVAAGILRQQADAHVCLIIRLIGQKVGNAARFNGPGCHL